MSNRTLNRMLDDFYPYAKEYLGFDKDAKISFASDKNNANKPLGKTAHYDPSNYSVTVYTDNRHPKDIMRSVSHELVHHAQNCRGDLSMSEDTGVGYAQNDEHLREMEREAYEKGNLCFRDWEDGIKSNLQPGTIYESRARRSKKSMNNFKTLSENFKKFLKEDWQDDPMSGMSGEDYEEYTSGVRATIEDILEMEGTSIQAIQSPMQLARLVGQVMQQPGVEESGLDEDDILELIDDMQQGMMQENEAGSYEAGDKVKDLRNDTVGTVVEPMAGGAVIELEDGTIVKTRDKFLEKVEGEPMQEGGSMAEYGAIDAQDGNPPSKIGRGNPEYMEAYNAVLIARGEEPLDVQQPDQAYLDALHSGRLEEGDGQPKQGDDVVVTAGGLAGAAGEVMELTTSTQGEPAVVIYLRKDADKQVMGKAGDEVIALVSDVQVDRGIQGDDSVEPEDDYNWVGHKAHYQEGTDVTEEYNGHLWENKIDKIVDMVMKEYGDHETQAQGGMVSSTQSSDPELDQIADIAATVVEQGGSLMQIATALKDQAFDTSLQAGVLMVDNKYFIGKPDKFDISPDEQVQEAGPYVVGSMGGQMEEGFRGSPEEKEMTSKMSNKEFSDYHTRDKHLTPDLKGDMGAIPGMEGPFQYASGAVLYYDPKAGKYYDRGSDRYLDNEEAARLTMENTQMKLENVNLREKVKTSVMNKLKEMYDDDDMYGEEDPYMAGLEAEFPWLADKKKGAPTPADAAAAEAAAAADAEAAGEFPVAPEEEEEDPTITMKEDDEAFASSLRARVTKRLQELSKGQEEMDLDDDGKIEPEDLAGLRSGKEDEDVGEEAEEKEKKEESLRDRVYRIVQETLNESDDEEEEDKEEVNEAEESEKDEDKEEEKVEEGKYKREKDDDEKEEQNESEEAEGEDPEADEDKEEVEENIAANPEDFFRKLRNESREVAKQENWNDSHRSKRSSMLNERLMKSWFNK